MIEKKYILLLQNIETVISPPKVNENEKKGGFLFLLKLQSQVETQNQLQKN
jgi:hypothetical protein